MTLDAALCPKEGKPLKQIAIAAGMAMWQTDDVCSSEPQLLRGMLENARTVGSKKLFLSKRGLHLFYKAWMRGGNLV